ncbi:MAG: RNA-guided pseudouridylation complex pseudouridine synthase subunit Cbf5, partial [bacterium]|nr:RNA-guided pseudouridylation complex pseudouridine synthase subunit Cbf5 [bacterium]
MNKLPFEKVKRELVVKKDSKTSPKFGFLPDKRPVDNLISYGIVNIDKPKGPTSHQVSAYVRQILKLDKAGHSGTLDPGVTGILPVALGSGTRISQLLLTAGKEYVALMHIHKEVPEGKVHNTFKEFVGKIKQLPPVKSAIKR